MANTELALIAQWLKFSALCFSGLSWALRHRTTPLICQQPCCGGNSHTRTKRTYNQNIQLGTGALGRKKKKGRLATDVSSGQIFSGGKKFILKNKKRQTQSLRVYFVLQMTSWKIIQNFFNKHLQISFLYTTCCVLCSWRQRFLTSFPQEENRSISQYLMERNCDGWRISYDLGVPVSASIYLAWNK